MYTRLTQLALAGQRQHLREVHCVLVRHNSWYYGFDVIGALLLDLLIFNRKPSFSTALS